MQYARTGILAVLGFYFFFYLIGGAQAEPIQDIPNEVASALGTTPDVAKLLLSCAILFAMGLSMAVAGKRANMLATIIVLIVGIGALTAIGWLTAWVLMFVGILIAVMFAGKIKESIGVGG